jgi:hypothetical protein
MRRNMMDKNSEHNLISSAIGTSLGAVVGALIVFLLTNSPGYIISMDDNSDLEFNSSFDEIRYINIDDEQSYPRYNSNILLSATMLNGTPLPSKLHIEFTPSSLINVPIKPKMIVKGTDLEDGCYDIKIVGFGANGIEKSCPYRLIVKTNSGFD